MVQRVPNPAIGGSAALKQLGTQSFTAPGSFTVTVPSGTRLVRMLLRGGGGGGGAASGGGTGPQSGGGGQGALQRRQIAIYRQSFPITIGAGGLAGSGGAGSQGGTSLALGFSAAGGGGGTYNVGTGGPGGGGVDGAEPLIGLGNFQGATGFQNAGGGPQGRQSTGTSGNGGVGKGQFDSGPGVGQPGNDGCALFEFFG